MKQCRQSACIERRIEIKSESVDARSCEICSDHVSWTQNFSLSRF